MRNSESANKKISSGRDARSIRKDNAEGLRQAETTQAAESSSNALGKVLAKALVEVGASPAVAPQSTGSISEYPLNYVYLEHYIHEPANTTLRMETLDT